MISYTSGNILDSQTQALVNTVNCDGYMGKGIAYQFKLKYPHNNEIYEKACRAGNFKIGDILTHKEDDKIIINFPTKDHWRKNSKIEFIEKGLNTLTEVIQRSNITSISIPPLGCGNGGLKWPEVKPIIEEKLFAISSTCDIVIFEPTENYSSLIKPNLKNIPKLNTSHLLLMRIKIGLAKFNKIRLQKCAYLVNIVSGNNYFKFEPHNFGPYAHSLDVLSRNIKEYQEYYSVNTEKAYSQAINTLISGNTISKLNAFNESLNYTLKLVNSITDDSKLELYTTILFIIQNKIVNKQQIIMDVQEWNEHKRNKFDAESILEGIEYLLFKGLITETLDNNFKINNHIIVNYQR